MLIRLAVDFIGSVGLRVVDGYVDTGHELGGLEQISLHTCLKDRSLEVNGSTQSPEARRTQLQSIVVSKSLY